MGGLKVNRKGGNPNFAQCVTDALRQIAVDYIAGDGEAKTLRADLATLRPVDRATIMEKYLKYVLPGMGTVSVKGDGDDGEINVIVSYKSPDPKSKEEDEDETNKMDYSEDL